jgi:murein DD-endopeptidase MepM/ murein hydrolase activator NlpD
VRGLLVGLLVTAAVVVVDAPRADAATDVEKARGRANAAAAAMAKAESKLSSVQRDLAAVEAKRQEAEARVALLRAGVRDAALGQFMRGLSSIEGLTVDIEDASANARVRVLQRIIASGSSDAIDEYRVAAEDLADQEARLASARSSVSSALASYRKQRAATEAELRRLVAIDKQRAATAAAAKRAVARPTTGSTGATRAAPTPVVVGSGEWVCPVQGPRAFSNDYGDARAGGRRHAGNDILAPKGTPVVAPVAGRAKRHDNRLGGISFYLYGADGITYYGAHLDSYSGASGNVAAGTVLGYVGNTGDARNGPNHLHFEMHPGGGSDINPYPTLRKYC